jgi:Mg2+ and Co2+ transporter CorA
MKNPATNQILSLIEKAEDKKRRIKDSINQTERQKDIEKSKLYKDEMKITNAINDENQDSVMHIKKIADEKSTVFELEHRVAELRKKYADVDKKISYMNHWTGQSEYEDKSKQKQALAEASKIYGSL